MKRRIGKILVPIAALAAIVLSVTSATGAASPIVASTGFSTTTLTADVVPNLASYADLGPIAPDQQLNVVVPLKHDDAAIASYEASLNDPSSSNYEQWLTPDQFQARFDAPAADVSTVRTFVTRDGLQLYNADGLGDLTLASGTAAQVERTFGVAIHNYLRADGTRFYANVNAPTVPSGVGVVGVLGLQNLTRMHRPPGLNSAQGQCTPVGGVCTGMLGPTGLWSVYNQPSVNYGNGESIAIIGEGRTDTVVTALDRKSVV